jgi:sterol desaturase/sphingolipid hydroxylase (fatty acid hydroxylase superfamily)
VILMKVFGKLFALVFVAIFVNIVVWGVLKRIWFVETDQTVEVSYLLFFKKTIQVKEMITYRQATDGQVFISFILIVISIAPLVLIPIYS